MTDRIINPATRVLIDAYQKDPVHALILTGENGVGLLTIASDMAASLSGSSMTVTTLSPEKGSISIERVRQLYEQTKSIQASKRCFIIDDADTMGPEAQNALLKLLEEPSRRIHFILTSHYASRLLPTIRSRAQQLNVLLVDKSASLQAISSFSQDENKQRQILFLAHGKPAELYRLASDEKYFASQSDLITSARSFLQQSRYEKLAIVAKYTDRAQALAFLSMCAKLLTFSVLKQRSSSSSQTMEVLDQVMTRIESNGHVRTHLMHLVTKLP